MCKDKVLISASHLLSLHLLHLLCLLFVPKFAYYLSECRAGCDDMLNWSWFMITFSRSPADLRASSFTRIHLIFISARKRKSALEIWSRRNFSEMHAGNLRHACCIFIVPKSIRKSLKTNIKKTNQAMYFDWGLIVVRLQWFMSVVKYKLSFSCTALMSTIDKWWWFLRFCTVFANCAALALKLSSRQEPGAAGIPALAYFTGLHWALNNGKLIYDVSSYVLIDFVWDMLRQLTENIENTDDVIIISWKTLEIVGEI